MDIKVGSIPALASDRQRQSDTRRAVEARVLAVRQPRKRRQPTDDGEERRKSLRAERDPANGRVLVLMVDDRAKLPVDFDHRKYRVFLRFAPVGG